ncbi:hypothetical protein [Actinoallomurus sp. NPDC050550]|uniref:hypothetical protein n=1 Tax=Actinoallomurus sp. NPDC050550 TaxID=3154937 RepID=UPI0033F085C6
MELPELADLVWLFEDEPTPEYEDMTWPVGLHSFRLRRGAREVIFSLDPTSGEVYLRISDGGEDVVSLGRLRSLEGLTVEKHGEREGLVLRFARGFDPLRLETRPIIRLSWDVMPLGAW